MLPLLLAGLAMHPCAAQSSYIDVRQKGTGAVLGAAFDGEGLESVSLTVGYSLDGLLDIGLSLRAGPGKAAEGEGTFVAAILSLGFTLLKQDQIMPFSLLLETELRSFRAGGTDASAGGELLTSSTGLGISLDLFQWHFLAPRLYGRLGGFVAHTADTRITERTDRTTGSGYPRTLTVEALRMGLTLGLSWRPNHPNRGTAFSGGVKLSLDGQGRFLAEPQLIVTVTADTG